MNIIAMRSQYNRLLVLATSLIGLLSANTRAQTVPLIVPESLFSGLPRVTGDLTNQRLMDLNSILKVQLPDPAERIPPATPLVLFRQGLRLKTPDGQTLGVLAVPIARGQTLARVSEHSDIADPAAKGVAWMRLQSLSQEVMRGDSVMTLSEEKQLQPADCKPVESGSLNQQPTAQVFALAGQANMLSTVADLLATSGGCAAGLTAGRTVTLWRPHITTYGRKLDQAVDAPNNNAKSVFDDNPPIAESKTPEYRVGTAVVIAAYPEAAILKIRSASHPVQPGDLVRVIAAPGTNPTNSQP